MKIQKRERLPSLNLKDTSFSSGADPGFYVGGSRNQEMGVLAPHNPTLAPSLEIHYFFGPTSGLCDPNLGVKNSFLAPILPQKNGRNMKRGPKTGPKSGVGSTRGGGQGPLAPAPKSATAS